MPSPSIRSVLVSTVLFLALAPAVRSGPAESPPVSGKGPELVERAEARLVQVDVSVVDPKDGSYRSVPGLSAEQFELKLDGRALSAEDRAALRFDPICDAAGDGMARPILVIVDFNYVDARGRAKVADAIDGLADGAAARPEVYKVYGLTRQVRELTPGFTRDPARLHEAAAAIRAVAFRGDDGAKAMAGVLARDDLAVLASGSGKGGCSG
ncbi:MAG: hypothetical protein MUF27_14010 [Acidobacteria bacterium]|nr:hypothetical protein [Acidobacteriota bacterium]